MLTQGNPQVAEPPLWFLKGGAMVSCEKRPVAIHLETPEVPYLLFLNVEPEIVVLRGSKRPAASPRPTGTGGGRSPPPFPVGFDGAGGRSESSKIGDFRPDSGQKNKKDLWAVRPRLRAHRKLSPLKPLLCKVRAARLGARVHHDASRRNELMLLAGRYKYPMLCNSASGPEIGFPSRF